MMAPTTLVSGGSGLVGRFIVEALLTAGHRVVVTGRTPPPEGFFSEPVIFREATLEPETVSARLFDGADAFVHAAFHHQAGKYRGGEGDDAEGFRRRNLDGSIAMFAAAKEAGVRRTVFLSSRAVYGPRPAGVMLDETDPCHPDTLYGAVKLQAEEALAAMADAAFTTASLRATGVYGPSGPGQEHKWKALFRDYLSGKLIAPRVGTEVHGDDLAAAVLLMLDLQKDAVSGRVFNVSDLVLDRSELLNLVARHEACAHTLPAKADAATVNVMRTERLRALGWIPGGRKKLKDTIPALLAP